jgi:cell division protein FtsQ
MPAAMMAQRHYSFPVVTGINANDSAAARKQRMAVYQRLLSELDANGQHISGQISEIDLTDPQDARVLMPEQGSDILAHFGQDQFLERYQRYKAHIVDWRRQFPKLSGVDLRYDQKVVLQMTPGNSVAQAAVDQQTAANSEAEQNKPSTDTEKSASIEKSASKVGAKPVSAVHSGANPPTGKPTTKAKTPAPKTTAAKTKAAKDKAAKDKAAKAKVLKAKAEQKKRAEAKRAALNVNRHPTAPATRPATIARMGQ